MALDNLKNIAIAQTGIEEVGYITLENVGLMIDLGKNINLSGAVHAKYAKLSTVEKIQNNCPGLSISVDEYINDNYNEVAAGIIRTSGANSSYSEAEFGSQSIINSVGSHIKLATVKNGIATHICAPGRITLDINNEPVAINGDDGDFMVITDADLYLLKSSLKDSNGTRKNVIGVSEYPVACFDAAKKIGPFGICGGETVNANISGDYCSCAHYIYNTNAYGATASPVVLFKDNGSRYKPSNGGGYPSNSVSCIDSIQQAQNKNRENNTNRPYMGLYYEFYEFMMAMMLTELKELDHNVQTLFGGGCTTTYTPSDTTWNDTAISGNSGFKIMKADNSVEYCNIWGQVKNLSNSNTQLLYGITGSSNPYSFVSMLETQRLLDGITAAGLVSSIGSKTNIFTYNDNNGVVMLANDINLDTGANMEPGKHYYIVRNVPGCQGMSDGVMTAVINSYTRLDFYDGIKTTGGTDLTDRWCIFKRSLPIYRGMNLPLQGLFRQSQGAHYVMYRDSSLLATRFECASDVDNIPPITDFGTAAYQVTLGSKAGLQNGLDKHLTIPAALGNTNNSNGWVSDTDYNLSLFCHTALGGNASTHESAYLWLYPNNNGGANTVQVHGSVLGCFTDYGYASARAANCDDVASVVSNVYGGAFAVPHLQFPSTSE